MKTLDAGHGNVALDSDFRSSEYALLLQQSYIGAWLMLFLIPAGISLDYFVYTDRWPAFAAYRVLADLPVLGALCMHRTSFGSAWPRLLVVVWLGAAIVMICGIIYVTEGSRSTYYAGLLLSLLAIGILLPLSVNDAVVMCAATILLYVLACVASTSGPVDRPALFNNLYFLVLASIICVTAVHFSAKRRFEDFELRRRLEKQNKQMAELDRLKSAFFANVSHELRTPLTLILGPTQDLLRNNDNNQTQKSALEIVERSALRLLRLVNDMLDLIRFEEGAATIETAPVDIGALLTSLADQMRYLATSQGLSLNVELGAAPLIVKGDAHALERVFINLLSNAVKFTPPGGTISVRAQASGQNIAVKVRDTGVGVALEEQKRIFDRFHQGSTSRRQQGLGLGLALVKQLVEHQGGSIEIESEIGAGTTMTVSLKRAVDGALQTPREQADALSEIHHDAALRGELAIAGSLQIDESPRALSMGLPRILVVDDEPDMRRYLVQLLQEEYDVDQAADGDEGLRKALANDPEVVLLDQMLPGMSGVDICKKIRSSRPSNGPKVILLTARVDEEIKISALASGADDFLNKPFNSLEVKTRLRNLRETARLERDLRARNNEIEDAMRKLQSAEAQLVHNEKLSALGIMSAGLLHEINNPINFANVAFQFVKRNSSYQQDSDLKETLTDIEDGFKRIQGIVADLRVFATPSRSDSHGVFRFTSALTNALRFTASQRSGIALQEDLDPEDLVVGNEAQVVQVLVNLLLNAARAARQTRGSEPRIDVSTEIVQRRLRVRLRDNGCGIEQDRISRIFDPFYTTRDVGEGMGLGLSISYRIIESHGGTLIAKSVPGEFAEFTFDLPIKRNEQTSSSENARIN